MAANHIIGRERELEQFQTMLDSPEAEFLVLYGRRRVGKTFLVREFFEQQTAFFELTGQLDTPRAVQLENFRVALERRFGMEKAPRPKNWNEAFNHLAKTIENEGRAGKQVLFFDEVPWLAGRRSGFLKALEYFWNTWALRNRQIILIACGSAAAWMIDNIVNNTGGLHNRNTHRIQLMPFNLRETEAYLRSRSINLERRQIVELYMCMGGIPQYLRHVERHLSAAQNIDRICFTRNGFLSDEFGKLFRSLFSDSEKNIHIVRILASRRIGMTRDELLKESGMVSGGTFTGMLEALEASGFISMQPPFGKHKNEAIVRLIDEFSIFHLNFIEPAPKPVFQAEPTGYWMTRSQERRYVSWAGISFESLCLKHIAPIKRKLGIEAISTVEYPWRYRPDTPSEDGAQVDLLIERADRSYSLCEIKFSDQQFVIGKEYARILNRKKQALQLNGKRGYSIFLVMITTYGLRRNEYSQALIDRQVVLEDLFA